MTSPKSETFVKKKFCWILLYCTLIESSIDGLSGSSNRKAQNAQFGDSLFVKNFQKNKPFLRNWGYWCDVFVGSLALASSIFLKKGFFAVFHLSPQKHIFFALFIKKDRQLCQEIKHRLWSFCTPSLPPMLKFMIQNFFPFYSSFW